MTYFFSLVGTWCRVVCHEFVVFTEGFRCCAQLTCW